MGRRRLGAIAGPPEAPFVLRFPDDGWEQISCAEAGLEEHDTFPTTILRRRDGRGVITVAARGPLAVPLEQTGQDLSRALAATHDDVRLVSSRPIQVPAGPGWYTSWVHENSGRVQSKLVVAVGERTYVLDAALPAGAADVAREVARVLTAFDVGGDAAASPADWRESPSAATLPPVDR